MWEELGSSNLVINGWEKVASPYEALQNYTNSEAVTLCKRFETMLAIPEARGVPGIHICLDNLTVAQEVGSVPNGSSQSMFERFGKCAKWWLKARKVLKVK